MTRRAPQPRAELPATEVDRLARFVPLLCASPIVSDWERQFCISVAGRIKRGPWWPTEKQAPILARLVDRFVEDMNGDLVERDEP